jgi:hypothetical protein
MPGAAVSKPIPKLVSVTATPASATLARGDYTRQFIATGEYRHGLSRDLTTAASWNSSAGIAIDDATGNGPLGDIRWTERRYTTSTGEAVRVFVSPSYPAGEAFGQRWADFFASLPHGPELPLLKAYVAPLSEVQAVCGGSAVGCYGEDQLIITNEPALGFAPEEVARHEYGHHIALNRSNAPWPAFDWGPKRWATAARICQRVHWNDVYPGDESLLYKLNPGEAFAEAYRVLVDTRLGEAHPAWPLVDPSFYPDQAALDAIDQDIVSPWTGTTAHVFHSRGPVWAGRVATPLDGTLTVRLAGPARLALIGDDGQAMRPTSQLGKTLTYQVCGERSVTIRVIAPHNRAHQVDLRVTTP